jgi:hypothetical protein
MNQQHLGSERDRVMQQDLAEQGRDELLRQLQRALDAVAKYAASCTPEGLLRDAAAWTRRDPALALGGAFLLGATLARVTGSRGAEHSHGSSRATPDGNTPSEAVGSGGASRSPHRDKPPAAPVGDRPIGVGSPIGDSPHAGGSA